MDNRAHGDRAKATGARDGRPRRLARRTGRSLIGLGVLLLLFVAYQLLGTNLQEARAQRSLKRDLKAVIGPPAARATTVDAPPAPPPEPGEAVALLEIPKIGVDKAVVEGVGVDDLRKAPGHYPGTPLPGQPGNVAIAGHRTTYGAPFFRLDELAVGDEIVTVTGQGRFRYRVDRTSVVSPRQVDVVAPTPDSRLTLTTCHPRFSASRRLVVSALLLDDPAPRPRAAPVPESGTVLHRPGHGGDEGARLPTVAWGVAATLVALAISALARSWRRWPAYLLGTLPFLAVLFVFYDHLAKLLPADF